MKGLRSFGLALFVASTLLACAKSGDSYLGTWKGTNGLTFTVTRLGDSYRVAVSSDDAPFTDVMTAKYENGSLIMGTEALVLSNGTLIVRGVAYRKQPSASAASAIAAPASNGASEQEEEPMPSAADLNDSRINVGSNEGVPSAADFEPATTGSSSNSPSSGVRPNQPVMPPLNFGDPPPLDATRTSSGLRTKALVTGRGKTHPTYRDHVTFDLYMYTPGGTREVTSDSLIEDVSTLAPAGLKEGIQLMVVDEIRQMWIPRSLAFYGPGTSERPLVANVRLRGIEAGPKPKEKESSNNEKIQFVEMKKETPEAQRVATERANEKRRKMLAAAPRLFVGNWRIDFGAQYGTLELRPDGSAHSSIFEDFSRSNTSIRAWTIAGDTLIFSSGTKDEARWRIQKIEQDEFFLEGPRGHSGLGTAYRTR